MNKEITHGMLLLVLIKIQDMHLLFLLSTADQEAQQLLQIAKKLFKKIIDRHEEREKIRKNNLMEI